MQHIFSSGEILYKENVKLLEEGELVAKYLVYDNIHENMEFLCLGAIDDRQVKVRFQLDRAGEEKVLFKKMVNILMQSDIFHSKWINYTLEWEE